MTLTEPFAAASGDAAPTWMRRLIFIACVGMVLTFTQFWQMPLTGPNGDPEASSLIRLLYFPAYGAAVVLACLSPGATIGAACRSLFIWLLIVDVFVSMTWSIDPETTQRRGVALLFTTLAAVVIASRYDWPDLLEVIAAAFAVVVVSCFFLGLVVRSYGVMGPSSEFPGAWRGVWQDKNALGDYMTVGFIVFVSTAILNPRRRWLWAGFAAGAVALVLLSTSKTSLVTLVIGSGCLTFVWMAKRGGAISVASTFLAVTALLALASAIVLAPDFFFKLLGKDATLTGRTTIWTSVLRLIHQRPWTGYGYAAVWTDESGWGPLAWIIKWSGFRPHHSHNSWLETWLAQGYPGLMLWGAVFLEAWGRGVWAVYTRSGGYFALPFLAVYSLTTLTESVAFIYNDLLWVIFVAMALRLATPPVRAEANSPRLAARWP